MLTKQHINNTNLIYMLFFVLLYFVFFQHLDSFHLRNWDESMFAVNAYEMSNNGNFFVPYYKGLPDMWNSKPPLQIWIQVLFIKIIGYNELAIRLPSAISSSITGLLLFHFVKKRSSLIFGTCVFLVFITSFGVSTFHSGRTGDSDALLSLFILCAGLSFYKWLFEEHSVSLFSFFIFLSLAFLTKSIVALLFLPAFIFLLIYLKKINLILKNKWFYIGLIFFLTISLSFLFIRETYNKGYLEYFFNNDIGRVSKVIESHKEPFDYYITNLFYGRFYWMLLVLPGALLLWINDKTKPLCIFLISLFTSYFLIISCSITKLEWYDLPLFPILSVLSAYLIYIIIRKIDLLSRNPKLSLIFLLMFFSLPLYYTFRYSYKSEIKPDERTLEILTEYAFKNKNNGTLNGVTFLTSYFDRPLYFYKYKLNTQQKDFTITSSIENLSPQSIVIVAEDSLKNILKHRYQTETIDIYRNVSKFRIK